MSRAMITEGYLTDIADAIRAKNGSSDTYTPPQMAAAIAAIPTGGGGGGVSGEIKTSGGTLQYSGVNIDSQPVIDENGMTANASSGLSFSFSIKLVIEFDLILHASPSSTIVWSFGGSNTNGGVYVISTSRFELYAGATRFAQNISLTAGVKYRMKMEFVGQQALLYADGVLIATGESSYVRYVMGQVIDGSIALLYNQSAHSEFNSSHVDNINISLEQVTT